MLRDLLEPAEIDVVAVMLDWAKRHGGDASGMLTLAPAEWARVWRMAQWHHVKRAAREGFARLR